MNKYVARVLYINTREANKCISIFKNKKSLISIYVEDKEVTCRGVISDWSSGIPELFETIDNRDDIIKMKRIRAKIYDKESKTLKMKETSIHTNNFKRTFKDKLLVFLIERDF